MSNNTVNSLYNEDFYNLESWGIPQGILQKYQEKGINRMFEWQVQCLSNENVIENNKNLIYSAPTSAGKTLISEILTIKTVLEKKKKVIIILPFVSIVREKMFYFKSIFKNSGVRVEGFMGSYNPPGGFKSIQIAICTIEKANNLVNRLLEEGNLDEIGTIVVDELHLLGDPSRGYLLELLLTKIRYMCLKNSYQIQIIGMSATLPNLTLLADWLNAELFKTDFRPIPLFEQCHFENKLFDRNFREIRTLNPHEDLPYDTDNIMQLCLETICSSCSVLIFCNSKSRCENLSKKIAATFKRLGCPESSSPLGEILRKEIKAEPVMEVLEQLSRCPVGLDSMLKMTIAFGVSYHHAGLTMDERDIIEGAFKRGALRVLVATSTLSSGVNLPARRVLIRSPTYTNNMIDILSYKQMIGRAGRMGQDSAGESILICQKNEIKVAKELMTAQLKPIASCLENSGRIKRAILEVLASGVAETSDDIDLFLKCTLLSASGEYYDIDILKLDCLEFLFRNKFIQKQKQNDKEIITATSLARACLSSSLPPEEGLILLEELEKARRCFVLESDLHIVYLVTPYSACYQWTQVDWREFLCVYSSLDECDLKVAELVGVKESFIMRGIQGLISSKSSSKDLQIHRRFYIALALRDLIDEKPLNEVADKYNCSRGLLQSLQQSAATFAGMVSLFSQKLGWRNIQILVSQFQNRLHFGVQSDLIDLMKLPLLNSITARAFFNSGLETIVDLASADVYGIEKALKTAIPFDRNDSKKNRRSIWITGKDCLTELEAAKMILEEARQFLICEIGLKVGKWEDSDQEKLTKKSAVKKSFVKYKSESFIKSRLNFFEKNESKKTNDEIVDKNLGNGIDLEDLKKKNIDNELNKRNKNEIISNNLKDDAKNKLNKENKKKITEKLIFRPEEEKNDKLVDKTNGENEPTKKINKISSKDNLVAKNNEIKVISEKKLNNQVNDFDHLFDSTFERLNIESMNLKTVHSDSERFMKKLISRPEEDEKTVKIDKLVDKTNENNESTKKLKKIDSKNNLMAKNNEIKVISEKKLNNKVNDFDHLFDSTFEHLNIEITNVENLNLESTILKNVETTKSESSLKKFQSDMYFSNRKRNELEKEILKKNESFKKHKSDSFIGLYKLKESMKPKQVETNKKQCNVVSKKIDSESLILEKPILNSKDDEKNESRNKIVRMNNGLDSLFSDSLNIFDSPFNLPNGNNLEAIIKINLEKNNDKKDMSVFDKNFSMKQSIDKKESSKITKRVQNELNEKILTDYFIETCNSQTNGQLKKSSLKKTQKKTLGLKNSRKKLKNSKKSILNNEFVIELEKFNKKSDSFNNSIDSLLANFSLQNDSSKESNEEFNKPKTSPECVKNNSIVGKYTPISVKISPKRNKSRTKFETFKNNLNIKCSKRLSDQFEKDIFNENINDFNVNSQLGIIITESFPSKIEFSNKEKKQEEGESCNLIFTDEILDNIKSPHLILTSSSKNNSEEIIENSQSPEKTEFCFTKSKKEMKISEMLIRNEQILNKDKENLLCDEEITGINWSDNEFFECSKIVDKVQVKRKETENLSSNKKLKVSPGLNLTSDSDIINCSFDETKFQRLTIIPKTCSNKKTSCQVRSVSSEKKYEIKISQTNLTRIQNSQMKYQDLSNEEFYNFTRMLLNDNYLDLNLDGFDVDFNQKNSINEILTQTLLLSNENRDLNSIDLKSIVIVDVYNDMDETTRKLFINKLIKRRNLSIQFCFVENTENSCSVKIGEKFLRSRKTLKKSNKICYKSKELIGYSIFLNDKKSYYFTLTDTKCKDSFIDLINQLFTNDKLTMKLFGCVDVIKILNYCFKVEISCTIEDPIVADWLLRPEANRINEINLMVKEYCPEVNEPLAKSINCEYETIRNNSIEAVLLWYIVQVQKKLLKLQHSSLLKTLEIEMATIFNLTKTEIYGFCVNYRKLEEFICYLESYLTDIEREVYQMAGKKFSFSKATEIAKVLGLYRGKKISMNKHVLEKCENPIAQLILLWRKLNYIIKIILNPLLQTITNNRVHCLFIHNNVTGRVSIQEPNIQNIPRNFQIYVDNEFINISCRENFIATNTNQVLVSADYCQLELRILTHFSQDVNLCQIMKTDQDVFTSIAAKWYKITSDEVTENLRHRTKQLCYGIIYGIGCKSLSEQLNLTVEEATELIASFHKTYPALNQYRQRVVLSCQRNGYVETLSNRRRYLPNINNENGALKSHAERQAFNTVIQGTAADIVKTAIVKISELIRKYNQNVDDQIHLVHFLHDELIYEMSKEKLDVFTNIIKTSMEEAVKLTIPLKVKLKVGPSWGDLKEI